MTADEPRSFERAVRSAGVLTAGRQVGAFAFTGGVLLLSRYARTAAVDPFLWAYFAQLLVSSILNFGLERFTARGVAGASSDERAPVLGSALYGRLLTAPLTPAALVIVLAFVHVSLPAAGWVALIAWTLSVQLQGVLFAGLRAAGCVSTEATIAVVGRATQTVLLIGAAIAGWGLVGLLLAAASVDIAVTLVAWKRARDTVGLRYGARLPYRKLAVYTAVEVLVFAYLRADLLLVGRLLGARPGATYGLAYRFVDALVALATPALLVLFAHASSEAARGIGLSITRRRAQALLPHLGVVLSAFAIVLVSPVADVVPRLAPAVPTLRLLLACVPLTYLIGAEALLLSAEDRNRPVILVAGASLVANVALILLLVPHMGMIGAAVALIVTEVAQAVGLAFGAKAEGARASLNKLATPVAVLLGGAVALNVRLTFVGVCLLLVGAAVGGRQMRTGMATAQVLVAR